MELYLLRDYIGLFAPIILLFLSLFLLRNKKKYLYLFFYGFILNNILNIILKVDLIQCLNTFLIHLKCINFVFLRYNINNTFRFLTI